MVHRQNTAQEKEVETLWFKLTEAVELFGLLFGALHETGFIGAVPADQSLIIKDSFFCYSFETAQ